MEAAAVIPRSPLQLRVSVTDRCSLRCAYCAPENASVKVAREEILSYEEITRFATAIRAQYGLTQVRLTGGEPLLRAGLDRLVAMLAAVGGFDLALTTNGQRLAEMAGPLKLAGLNRLNISLDSLSPATFAAITHGGSLQRTIDGIVAARRAGLDPIKLNMVVMRGENDHEVADLVRFAAGHGCQMRFLELMPIGVAAAGFENRFVSSAEVLERMAGEFALTALPVDPRSTSRNFVAEDQSGRWTTIGLISPSSRPFCAACRRLRLTATGVLLGCLARPTGIPIAPLLRRAPELDAEALAAAVDEALDMKRSDSAFVQPQAMVGIGG
jgi:cyclic pyranopterin phosphate synthase